MIRRAAYIVDVSPSGYTFYHRPRLIGRGGGVGFLISRHCKVNIPTLIIPVLCAEISYSSFSAYFVGDVLFKVALTFLSATT